LDVNPYEPIGINPEQIRFLDVFLTFCLFHDSPKLNEKDVIENNTNFQTVLSKGRCPKTCTLSRNSEEIKFKDWANEILTELKSVAKMLDKSLQTEKFNCALEKMSVLVESPSETPSEKILQTLKDSAEPFYTFICKLSDKHARYFKEQNLPKSEVEYFQQAAIDSLVAQEDLEESRTESFESYLANYFLD